MHSLTNLSSGHAFVIQVPDGQEPSAVARSFLGESGLPTAVQRGFFVAVYPNGSADFEPDVPEAHYGS